MNWFAVQKTYGYEDVDSKLYVFDSKKGRDAFLRSGSRYAWSLNVPWETFPVKASEARAYANVDDFGDRYANLYWGGVKYVWGCKNYERRTA